MKLVSTSSLLLLNERSDVESYSTSVGPSRLLDSAHIKSINKRQTTNVSKSTDDSPIPTPSVVPKSRNNDPINAINNHVKNLEAISVESVCAEEIFYRDPTNTSDEGNTERLSVINKIQVKKLKNNDIIDRCRSLEQSSHHEPFEVTHPGRSDFPKAPNKNHAQTTEQSTPQQFAKVRFQGIIEGIEDSDKTLMKTVEKKHNNVEYLDAEETPLQRPSKISISENKIEMRNLNMKNIHGECPCEEPLLECLEDRTGSSKTKSKGVDSAFLSAEDVSVKRPLKQFESVVNIGSPRVNNETAEFSETKTGLQELYYNSKVNRSDVSSGWEECVTEEGIQSSESFGMSDSGPSDPAARAQYYHNKLMATLQILQNKEETVRVQSESLELAEQRIASLTLRASKMRQELDRKALELQSLRKIVDSRRIEKSDVSVTASTQEVENLKTVLGTLQSNLSVIEELYRECFYETAKQEELVEMLRKSYLDVRLTDREKTDRIGRLQNVINTQKWSLEQCQDIAMDVENLKTEISNFLNNSNNDSGMWEETIPVGLGDDLHDIMQQLMQLMELLKGDACMCGLEEKTDKLKTENEAMKSEIGELRQKVLDLVTTLSETQSTRQRREEQIILKDKELSDIRQELDALNARSNGQCDTCEALIQQLHGLQVVLADKSNELERVQEKSQTQELTIKDLKEELNKANRTISENCKVRSEVSHLTQQVSIWRRQLEESSVRSQVVEAALERSRDHCQQLDICYREKERSAAELQRELTAAQERGAELCVDSRRALCAVRQWVRRMRDQHREQEEKIKEQEFIIGELKRKLDDSRTEVQSTAHENTPSCSKSITKQKRSRVSETDGCVKYPSIEITVRERASGSEIASCSTAPVPPRRLLRKKLPICGDKRCTWVKSRDASAQEPMRRESGTNPLSPSSSYCQQHDVRRLSIQRIPRDLSPSEDVLEHVERLHEAMVSGRARWSRYRPPRTYSADRG